MATPKSRFPSVIRIDFLVVASGLAGLSWEVVWQIKSSLALGVSAWGTALTLAILMGGMSTGSFLAGRWLKDKRIRHPVFLYGILECVIGLCGLLLAPGFHLIEQIDTQTYAVIPEAGSLVHVLGITAMLGIPALCMGATLPVFGLAARQFDISVATLYGLNTLGGAAGALLTAFLFIPLLGVTHASWFIAALDMAVALAVWTFDPGALSPQKRVSKTAISNRLGEHTEQILAVVTGYATLSLEIAWFRSLTAAFKSTTDAFAIMLAAILIGLGSAAWLVPLFKKQKTPLGKLMIWAAVAVLVATPLVERFDFLSAGDMLPAALIVNWFVMTLFVVGTPVLLLGTAFPWIIDGQKSARRLGMLYALNTCAAIAGSLGAAWILLPAIGFARTAWISGLLVGAAGIWIAPRKSRFMSTALVLAALLVAVTAESGVGRTRIQGASGTAENLMTHILQFFEGPEGTVSAVEFKNGDRALIVDGFIAAAQLTVPASHYMPWMGHLPMLLHPDPQNALVICFGTGQTANAVRQENPRSLDIVDINPRVFQLAHNFAANENVLDDPRVHAIAMDGRAYMRRTEKIYDVITLEPMPPDFAGVNALYSKEFYESAARKLSAHGVIAQWLPFHLVAPYYMASIVKTFRDVFPNAILWIDPPSKTGILIGTKDNGAPLGARWPGFRRVKIKRDMSEKEIRAAVWFGPGAIESYSAYGRTISDDNQLLAYGDAVIASHVRGGLNEQNMDLLARVRTND